MKYSVIMTANNIVYAHSPCRYMHILDDDGVVNEIFYSQVHLNERAVQAGHKLVMVDDSKFPIGDIFDCEYDWATSTFTPNQTRMEWRAKTDIRAIREVELAKTDYLAMATFLTEEQRQQYSDWKQSWLDAPDTLNMPNAPDFVESILNGNMPDVAIGRANAREEAQLKIDKIK